MNVETVSQACYQRCLLITAVIEVVDEIPAVRNIMMRKKKAQAFVEKNPNNGFGAAVNDRARLLCRGDLPVEEAAPAAPVADV